MKANKIAIWAAALAAAGMMSIFPAYAEEMTYENVAEGLTKSINGDVSGDGKVNVTDISKTAAHVKAVAALDGESLELADVNEDGKISVTDVSSIAAQVKGVKLLPEVSCGSSMKKARALVDSDSFTVKMTSTDGEVYISVNSPEYTATMVTDPNSEGASITTYTLKDNKYYVLNGRTKMYTEEEVTDPSRYSIKTISDTVMGRHYVYQGYKTDGNKLYEVYKTTSSEIFYVYEFDDGVFVNTTRYMPDGAVSVMNVDEFKEGGEVTAPDLEGYTKYEKG